jgi:YesN/AraC family two-component response regulator
MGWDVFEADDGVAGSYLVTKTLPDLVISDVHMPMKPLRGREVLEAAHTFIGRAT